MQMANNHETVRNMLPNSNDPSVRAAHQALDAMQAEVYRFSEAQRIMSAPATAEVQVLKTRLTELEVKHNNLAVNFARLQERLKPNVVDFRGKKYRRCGKLFDRNDSSIYHRNDGDVAVMLPDGTVQAWDYYGNKLPEGTEVLELVPEPPAPEPAPVVNNTVLNASKPKRSKA